MSLLRTPLRLAAAVMAVGTLAGGALAVSSTPAFADGGSLTSVGFSVSNNAASLGDAANTADYTWTFVTGTSAALDEVDMTVPDGTAAVGTLQPTAVTGLNCTGGTLGAALSDTTVTVQYTGSTCTSVAAGTPVTVTITSFDNSTTTAAPFSSSVTTKAASSTVDTGTSNSVSFENNTTGVTVIVPESLTFTNNGPASVTLLPVPGAPAVADPVSLGVTTNAQGGYTLSACMGTDLTSSGGTIGPVNQTTASTLPAADGTSAFGAAAHVTGSAGAQLETAWAGTGSPGTPYTASGKFLGYATSCGSTKTDPEVVSYDNASTSGDTLTLYNGVGVSSSQASGTYTGTVSYQVTPTY